MDRENRVWEAMIVFVNLYKGDGDLVRPGAEHHGVQVIEADVFDPLSRGNYNFRIPRKVDISGARELIQARRILWECEDYRQSTEVVEELDLHPETGDDAVIAVAGGAAQPEHYRFDAMVNLIVFLSRANPEQEQTLLVHDEVCGGANHYTDGAMKRILDEQGTEAEQAEIVKFRTKMVDALIKRGVNPDKIRVGLAVVEHNKFAKLK